MASPSSSPTKPAAEELNPALKPVVERHGRELVDFTLRLAAANMALDWLMTYSQTHSRMKPQVGVLLESQADICNLAVTKAGWSWDKVAECMGDIGRAAALAGTVAAGPGNGN